ncbi:MAG: Zn-dependent exopeptidase M28 [Treponema sp.]|nr:Zn-dependent exopeptidase M28 [Treponema sp.]
MTGAREGAERCEWAKHSPYDRYFDFIAPDADRYAILLECINTLKLDSAAIDIEGNRHIFIFPPGQKSLRSAGGVFPFNKLSPYLLSAHYDRVPGSPGANDNSIAVFHLLNTAAILAKRGIDKWIIVFTDKEELAAGESLEKLGSFSMGKKLKSWGLEKAKIYNFDACGCGGAFIFSTTTDLIVKTGGGTDSVRPNLRKVSKNIASLRDYALETAQRLRLDRVLLAPTPFSDDVGFLRAGLAAQTVTMLPVNEAGQYESLLRSRPDFGNIIISGEINAPAERRNLPETWRSLNNAQDTPSRLTPQYFEMVVKFMVELVQQL